MEIHLDCSELQVGSWQGERGSGTLGGPRRHREEIKTPVEEEEPGSHFCSARGAAGCFTRGPQARHESG